MIRWEIIQESGLEFFKQISYSFDFFDGKCLNIGLFCCREYNDTRNYSESVLAFTWCYAASKKWEVDDSLFCMPWLNEVIFNFFLDSK